MPTQENKSISAAGTDGHVIRALHLMSRNLRSLTISRQPSNVCEQISFFSIPMQHIYATILCKGNKWGSPPFICWTTGILFQRNVYDDRPYGGIATTGGSSCTNADLQAQSLASSSYSYQKAKVLSVLLPSLANNNASTAHQPPRTNHKNIGRRRGQTRTVGQLPLQWIAASSRFFFINKNSLQKRGCQKSLKVNSPVTCSLN